MGPFNKGDKVRRKHEYKGYAGWHLGRSAVTVSRCTVDALGLEEDKSGRDWEPSYFELVYRASATVGPAPTVGRKDDSGKLDFTLLDDMPRALSAVVEVMQWASTKKEPVPYDRGSWIGVDPARYNAAQQRHNVAASLQASKSGGNRELELDPETNLLHAAHKACSALMELELILRKKEANA